MKRSTEKRFVEKAKVPQVAVPRLARYLRLLNHLDGQEIERVSSREIADHLGVNAAQIRKDLSYFGEFGMRGVGYDVKYLVSALSRCLGVDRGWTMVILGAGQLGSALVCHGGFWDEGFDCVGVFDYDGDTVGNQVGGLTVRPLAEAAAFIRDHGIQIAMIALPAESAVEVADLAAQAGVRGIISFAPVSLPPMPGVFIHELDLSAELMVVSFHLARGKDGRR